MDKYHVHIYKIESKAEIEVIANSEEEARAKALSKRDDLDYKKSDCNFIAMEFKVKTPGG